MAETADFFRRVQELEIRKWAGIIRSQRPGRGRLRTWWWRRHWQHVEARALAQGGPLWHHTIRHANRRAGVTDMNT